MITRFRTIASKYLFLFSELTKRDFKEKYKRTVLGMGWSLLSPLLTLLVMRLVFTEFFGRNTEHYTIYLFCGNLIFSYFKESTVGGMHSLLVNREIISKINIPKYFFLLSKNVSSLINFALILVVFFVFCIIDGIHFGIHFAWLLFCFMCVILFNIGMGLVLSALIVFFRDLNHLYDIFTLLLMYLSAIFYRVDFFPESKQILFLLNPIYVYIKYFRLIVIDGTVPSLPYHLLCVFYASLILSLGIFLYKKNSSRFIYYL